jgi:hypothetical protein
MDLLGVFKEKIRFLKIRIRLNPPYTDPAKRDPRIAGAAWSPAALHVACPLLAAAGDPAGCRAARRGAGEHVAETGAVSHSGSGRI